MRPERLTDVTRPAMFSVKLNRLEVMDVVLGYTKENFNRQRNPHAKGLTGVEEHISDGRSFLVNFEGMTSQNDPFGDDAGGVGIKESSCSNEVGGWKTGSG